MKEMDEIGCFIPDQHGSIVLHGITDSALDVNIITPQGIRRLSAFKFPTHPIPSMQIAAAYTASSRMELGVFSLRLGKKSAYEMFYVVDQQPLGQQGSCDVILGRTSAIHRILHPVNTGSHLAPVGVQQLTPAQKQQLAAAEEAKNQKLAEEQRKNEEKEKQERAAGRRGGSGA